MEPGTAEPNKPRKRLIVCCDGTWKSFKDPRISNIEKIARAITTWDGETPQLVHYCNGVGTGATLSDRIVGGAFGHGLNGALVDSYRFLVLNYEPGDEIFVFGFSRGAYTARSLVGMIGKVGLLTADALASPDRPDENLLEQALSLYQESRSARSAAQQEAWRAQRDRFKDGTTHGDPAPRIRFVGVFDTVGAMGVPGVTRHRYKFLDVTLGDSVDVARQALAIDERRLTFDPCVWTRDGNTRTDLQQVWFEGVHSDIGGGLKRPGPSELTLAWMVDEARQVGLAFDFDRLPTLPAPDCADPRYEPNSSMNPVYQAINVIRLCVRVLDPRKRIVRHRRQSRLLELRSDGATPLYIARPAYERWCGQATDTDRKRAKNVTWWVDGLIGRDEVERARIVDIPPLCAPVTAPEPERVTEPVAVP
ncbi:DUF2235 domain-containing protein [Gordonia sp. CPCC 206044]|uniref:DUF2235 domain-containing protein n=1 Tax=Gordonia sp. CPCC 206044 TaxID=3140793 RepID=UPI003AF34777